MAQTAEDARQAALQGNWAMILLGLAGPISGVVMGYGVAKGLKHSIYRLSVRVQDMAHHLGRDVATVNVEADGDFQSLDQRMQHIVQQVEEVTARSQRQQRELLRAEQLAAVGKLAAGVAHEVRNPLTGIKMLVEAARLPDNPRPLDSEDLRIINQELSRVERTVQGLLDYARLPAPQLQPRDVAQVVSSAIDAIRPRAETQKVSVNLRIPAQTAFAMLDSDQIHTVFVNLMLNALDAMPGGGQLDITSQSAETGRVQLTFADTGTGINGEIAKNLFVPFATTKPTGTGLGLSVSARIIEEHGGTISAANRAEGGACFTMTLRQATKGERS